MRHYIYPFWHAGGLHLVVGPEKSGKTSFTLQSIKQLIVRPEPEPNLLGAMLSSPLAWGQFEMAKGMDLIAEPIVYLDCLRDRARSLEHFSRLEIPVHDPAIGNPGVHVVSLSDIRNARKDTLTAPLGILEVVEYCSTVAGRLPAVLIVDAFSIVIPSDRNQQQHISEAEWIWKLQDLFLKQGGCFIGIQTFTKNGKIPGVGTPGTFSLSGGSNSLIEIQYAANPRKFPNRRKAIISGTKFQTRSMPLEFDSRGELGLLVGADAPGITPEVESDGKSYRVTEEGKLEVRTSQPKRSGEIMNKAVMLSIDNGRFETQKLIEECEKDYIPKRTVHRWLEACLEAGTIVKLGHGVFRLDVPPLTTIN